MNAVVELRGVTKSFGPVAAVQGIGLTLYRLQAILDGDLDEVIQALTAARAQQQLESLEAGA